MIEAGVRQRTVRIREDSQMEWNGRKKKTKGELPNFGAKTR
jgi:hypothetical protein